MRSMSMTDMIPVLLWGRYTPAMELKVNLAVFAGPLDLLIYLVKKHEVDVTEVPIALITREFCDYL